MSDDANRILHELKNVPILNAIPEEELIWLSQRMTEVQFEEGTILAKEGGPADTFHILLEGEFQLRSEALSQDGRLLISRAGEIVGKLPYSRLTHWPGSFRAVTAGRALRGTVDLFPQMVRETPVLVQLMVSIMSDRIRYTTKEDQQRDKMAALGKLSAGLAHELNNPAASAKRAALALSEAHDALREATARLDHHDLTKEQKQAITSFERQAIQHMQAPVYLDSLTQSEQEDEITAWLERSGVSEGWRLAPVLVEATLEISWLESLKEKVGEKALPDALLRIVSQLLSKRLTRDIESSTGRISDLVKAIKEYSYMDQAPIQEIDLHHGIENTLVMLGHKLKQRITVEKSFDLNLPKICAYGGELNQVWTNLIDNAVDAMKNGGTLSIQTRRDDDQAVILIKDTGEGVPEEIRHRIFEPFFTTKKMGQGTGLGLDTVWRIVRKHRGTIQVESCPGETKFEVRLPLSQPKS